MRARGIFCLEGEWDRDLRCDASVQPVLDLLSRCNNPQVPYIRRDIATKPEFEYYLKKWCQRMYETHPILYLGFHGDPGKLYLGDRATWVDLDWLEERLEGRCKGRIIHFGSCGTVAIGVARLKRFLLATQAQALCGYRLDVDWMAAAAFETILLRSLQRFSVTRSGMLAVQRQLRRDVSGLIRDLSFRMIIQPSRHRGGVG
ncbi:MAG: hypothetical protein KDK99_03635 [Verrucomicrobiales bacterium]|nr:hypothetical protein [Verrucomicrobiales bacterium]